jgi:REP element-mobilizing transposase RayT
MSIYFRRKLPHYHLPNATYFVTFRLAGSLPVKAIERLKQEHQAELQRIDDRLTGPERMAAQQKAQADYFTRYDALLDQAQHGPRWLAQAECAQTVLMCIRELDPQHYHLHACCIMPNHVHLLFDQQDIPDPPAHQGGKHYTALSQAMRMLKGKSAALCNRILNRWGAFWQHESYDHVVRNEREHRQILQYILENPVKAGLVSDWEQWPYTYVTSTLRN